eukprot:1159593-Pelagomonas_calceolata.AAC.5
MPAYFNAVCLELCQEPKGSWAQTVSTHSRAITATMRMMRTTKKAHIPPLGGIHTRPQSATRGERCIVADCSEHQMLKSISVVMYPR